MDDYVYIVQCKHEPLKGALMIVLDTQDKADEWIEKECEETGQNPQHFVVHGAKVHTEVKTLGKI